MSAGFSSWLLAGGLWVALGILQIAFAAEFERGGTGGLSKYKFGGDSSRRWWQTARGGGWLSIGLGIVMFLMHLGDPNAPLAPWLLNAMGGAMILLAFWGVFIAPHVAEWRQRLFQRRLVHRLERGSDAYFEEQRALEAYAPVQISMAYRRWHAAIALTFGALFILLANTI